MNTENESTFVTVAMAEILLTQNQLDKAEEMINTLYKISPDDERVILLKERLALKKSSDNEVFNKNTPLEKDSVALSLNSDSLLVDFELTDEGLAIAKRAVRYSGRAILRLFTAAPGPRGVRTSIRDFELTETCASFKVAGIPQKGVFAASVGFLGHSGLFVPMARALPVSNF
ncbi:MAG: tetratricopeptide repeat protein [Deltaproteobacteria bacterium]|nr:tetratricopeptide repeat protein [Deltaproteobacteria bacterium]